jgi:uncharacterized membrane protein YfcA
VATDWLVAAALAFLIAAATAPVGVSGAVFLIPVQISVLETPSPAITPTNLLYNLIAIPGALLRFSREAKLRRPLTRLLVVGTLPGVVVGAVVRVELLSGADAFLVVVAAVLGPLGAWLLLFRPPAVREAATPLAEGRIMMLAAIVGAIGGIYGIGGGSILAPILVGLGFTVVEVAPAALAATFLTSIAGVAAYALLGLQGDGNIAPDWLLGVALGVGGLGGSYLGAVLQPRMPQLLLRRLLGLVALAAALRYLVLGGA